MILEHRYGIIEQSPPFRTILFFLKDLQLGIYLSLSRSI